MNQVLVEKTKNYLVVKIPLLSVKAGKAILPSKAQKTIHKAIEEGLGDIASGRVFGPFKTVKKFKAALNKAQV